jgi:hypothetical protein
MGLWVLINARWYNSRQRYTNTKPLQWNRLNAGTAQAR